MCNNISLKVKRPALRYHGGKWRMADKIIPLFPLHQTYVEPFGGGGSILLRKTKSKNEIYNDLDSDVVNLFKVCRDQDKAKRLIELLELTPFAREELYLAWEDTECEIEQARRLVTRSQLGFGSAGATKSRTGFRGLDKCEDSFSAPAKQFARYPQSLLNVIERFKDVVIENMDALKLIDTIDTKKTFFYFDPPYMPDTRSSMKGGQKYYRHEMSESDHEKLLIKIINLKGMSIISGYDSELYNDILKDWRKETFKARASSAQGAIIRNETVWISPNIKNELTLF